MSGAAPAPSGRAGLVGPLFYYELIRLARRGRSTVLRCVYALAVLPIFCLLQWWGGVDVHVLVPAFAVTGLTLLSVGGISILCSALFRSVPAAVVSSYLAEIVFSICCCAFPARHVASPFVFLWELNHRLT